MQPGPLATSPRHRPPPAGPSLLEVYDAHSPTVYAYLRRRLGPGEAEDVTAEVFCAAARAFDEGRGHRVTISWLMVTARNLVIDRWRRRERHRARAHLVARRPPPPDEATQDRVLDALDRLAPRQRAALVLRYLEDRPVAEVADLLGLGMAATESLLARGRRELRRRLAELDRES